MKCAVCKNGELVNKLIEYQAKIGKDYIVVKNVPAEECSICGEQFLDYETIKKIEKIVIIDKKPIAYIEVPVFDMVI